MELGRHGQGGAFNVSEVATAEIASDVGYRDKSLHDLVGKLEIEDLLEMNRQPQSAESAERQILGELGGGSHLGGVDKGSALDGERHLFEYGAVKSGPHRRLPGLDSRFRDCIISRNREQGIFGLRGPHSTREASAPRSGTPASSAVSFWSS